MTLHHVGELAVALALGGGRVLGTAVLEALGAGIAETVTERFGRRRARKLGDLEAEAERRRAAFRAKTIARADRVVGRTAPTAASLNPGRERRGPTVLPRSLPGQGP